jgi:methylmalonyl-CoA/ethylmalonyl-CoA epimerase
MPKINHLAIVVEDIPKALAFWHDALGLPIGKTERNEREEVDIAFLPLASGDIELISPINQTSGVAKFLSRNGQGVHHVCIEVDDIEAMMRRLSEHGVMLLSDKPRTNEEGTRYCFIHPKSASGLLVELYELAKP